MLRVSHKFNTLIENYILHQMCFHENVFLMNYLLRLRVKSLIMHID